MKHNMNILISTNSRYFMASIAMLQSLFDNNKSNISVYMLYSDLSHDELHTIKNLIDSKVNGSLFPLEVDDTLFNNAPVLLHFTKEIYYRLLAQDILPKELDRVLYLDVDIIVNKSLDNFYNQNFDNNYLIACEGIGMSRNDRQAYDNLGIPFDRRYFNSGVILYNLKLLRESVDTTIFFNFIKKYSNVLKMPDQDILNALFYDNVKYQDYKIYNCGVIHIRDREDEKYARNNAAIIHYIGSSKPWQYVYISYLDDLFWKYARKAGYRRQYYEYKIKNTIYKLLYKTKSMVSFWRASLVNHDKNRGGTDE